MKLDGATLPGSTDEPCVLELSQVFHDRLSGDDRWLPAEEALVYGLIDAIV